MVLARAIFYVFRVGYILCFSIGTFCVCNGINLTYYVVYCPRCFIRTFNGLVLARPPARRRILTVDRTPPTSRKCVNSPRTLMASTTCAATSTGTRTDRYASYLCSPLTLLAVDPISCILYLEICRREKGSSINFAQHFQL